MQVSLEIGFRPRDRRSDGALRVGQGTRHPVHDDLEPTVDYPATLALLASGGFDTDVLISAHIPLERLVEDGLEELPHHADRHVKILVDPS